MLPLLKDQVYCGRQWSLCSTCYLLSRSWLYNHLDVLPKVPFSASIWANPQDEIETCALDLFHKSYQVEAALKVQLHTARKHVRQLAVTLAC